MRNFAVAVAVLALAVPLVGGAQEGGDQADGWETRLDGGTDATSVLHFRTMGTGLHASTAGRGAAIFWQPNSMLRGTTLSARRSRRPSPLGTRTPTVCSSAVPIDREPLSSICTGGDV